MAMDYVRPELTQRSSSPDRSDLEIPPTIGLSGWVAIVALLALSYVALAHADIKGHPAEQETRSMSADAFMLVVGSGR